MNVKNKLNYPGQRQLHKKRRLLGAFIFFLIILWFIGKKPDDILHFMISQVIPFYEFEAYYGNNDDDYLSTYDVPDWFFEDEGEKPQNDDMASMENEEKVDGIINDTDENTMVQNEAVMAYSNKSKGTQYTREQLADVDFIKSRIFSIDGNTSMTDEETRLENLLDVDLSLSDIGSEPKILIYHTHASESFSDSRPGVSEDTVVGIGSYLADLLNNQYGIPTFHDETAYDIIDGHLDRSRAYENAYDGISQILKDNPSIEVVIDLHRDGVDEDTHLITEVNGKPTAKIMFLNGVSRSNMNGDIDYLQNPNKLTNLAFSFQLYLAGKEEYGDYVRKIYVRSLRYNLHVMPRATLIEAGAQNNTIEEEKNAMEPLAAMLDKVLRNSK